MDKVVPNTVIDTDQFNVPASVAAWRALREPRITVWWALELAVREASFPPTLDVYVDTEGNRRWELGNGKALARKWVMDSFRAFCSDHNVTPRNPYSPLAKDFNGEGWQSTFTISAGEFEQWLSAYATKERSAFNESADTASKQRTKPVQRLEAQDNAVLDAVRQAGYEPRSLPKNETGKPGVKAEIRSLVTHAHPHLFPSKGTVFKKAWDRLRSSGDLADRE